MMKRISYTAYPGIIASPVSGKPIRAFSPMPWKKKQVKTKRLILTGQSEASKRSYKQMNPIYKSTTWVTTTYSNITRQSHFKSTTKSYSFYSSNSWYTNCLNKETDIMLVWRSSVEQNGGKVSTATKEEHDRVHSERFSNHQISFHNHTKTNWKRR